MPWSPKADKNGIFCWIVKFETSQDAADLSEPVTELCQQWIADNNNTSGEPVILGEEEIDIVDPYDYFRAFTKYPYVVKAEGNSLWLRFDGIYGSYWWRDWLVRVLGALRKAFPELNVFEFDRNCTDNPI